MEPFLITVNLAIYQIIEHLDKEGVSGNLLDVLNKVFSLFNSISTYTINQGSKIVEEFKDELTETQKTILKFLGITQDQYWESGLMTKN
ncbi:MAG: hypothetical protein J7M30_09330 [Deltaproteobacteria bacterium]|nr:hypothetical protein [Deltaproteobacteria bacterium]